VDGERYDLTEPGQTAVVAHGGSGGHGNKRFATSTRQAPRFAERGLDGESGWIELRLKLLADAGFVGLPNAGKSSLLARMTRAAPKVADYPFTTIEPVLGTLDFDDRQLVLADIPGLIAGAAAGAGLGHEFLAHVERCRLLLHVLDVSADEPLADHEVVRAELVEYGHGLAGLPQVIVVSKADLVPVEELDGRVDAIRDRLGDAAVAVVATSAATGAGLDELRRAIAAATPEEPTEADAEPAVVQFESEHRVYRPAGEGGFSVEKEDGSFRVTGRGIELLFERHDLSNTEALAYLEQRLAEIGVIAALRRAGFESGDEVRVGEQAFDLRV
jgi:GTP-binding protein